VDAGERVEFRLPDLGEGIYEAQVLAWNVRPGDPVEAYQPICQVESAKAAVELTAPAAGRIAAVGVAEGGTIHVGEILVVIETGETETETASTETPDPAAPAEAEPSAAGGQAPDTEYWGIVGAPPPARPEPPGRAGPRVLAAPFVRRLARERGVPLGEVVGTGPRGRVRIVDLEAHLARRSTTPSSAPAEDPGDERVPLQGLRKRTADHMVAAMRHAPQVTAMDLLDVSELVRARDRLRAAAEAEGVRLTYLPFVVKAAVQALRAVPDANAVVDESGEAIVRKRVYNVGVATAVPGGLVVPVVKHADRLSILELASEIERLVEAARARRSTREELSGGTFTVSSFGGLPGSPLYATPIVNYPEVAILGVGRIEPQPRVVDGVVVPRHCAGVSFTFDHRVLDGEGAARFMRAFGAALADPLQLLLHLR